MLLSTILLGVSATLAQTVTVREGPVQGQSVGYFNTRAVKYLGIPYAAPPVGDLRFAPPQPAKTRTGVLKATATPLTCPQQFQYPPQTQSRIKQIFNNPGYDPPVEGEDCLTLNVFVPPGTTPSSKLPVFFWIYGGNLQFGSAQLNFYDGSYLAGKEGVIVVVPNYRTNVFGFSNSPEIASPDQNAGLLDQRAALKWTQDNIAAFGGDPTKVTLAGESAGGWSVKQLMALPPAGNQFRGAILESEAVANAGTGPVSWQALVAQLNCTTAASPIACVRTKDAKTIKSIIETQVLLFGPQYNGVTAVSDIRPLIASGQFAKVPFIIGTNLDEGRAFTYLFGLDALALVPGVPNIPNIAVADVLTDAVFQCPAATIASLATARGYQVYRYQFDGVFPNVGTFPDPGAYHSVEIPEVFGTYPRQNALGAATADQISLSKYMAHAWATFVKTGKPTTDWPSYGLMGNVQALGSKAASGGATTVPAVSVDQRCALYGAYFATVAPL